MPKHRKPTGSYHHGDLREALLSEGLRVIEQKGLSELSLRDLARRLGVSSAAPYHHFANRTELLMALADAGFERLQAHMQEDLSKTGPSATDRLMALGRCYLRFAQRHPFQFRLMFRPDWLPADHQKKGASCADPGDSGEGGFELLKDVVTACLEEAGRKGEDPMPSVLAMWGAVHGIASLRLDGPLSEFGSEADVDELCERALEALGRGLKVPPSELPRPSGAA